MDGRWMVDRSRTWTKMLESTSGGRMDTSASSLCFVLRNGILRLSSLTSLPISWQAARVISPSDRVSSDFFDQNTG